MKTRTNVLLTNAERIDVASHAARLAGLHAAIADETARVYGGRDKWRDIAAAQIMHAAVRAARVVGGDDPGDDPMPSSDMPVIAARVIDDLTRGFLPDGFVTVREAIDSVLVVEVRNTGRLHRQMQGMPAYTARCHACGGRGIVEADTHDLLGRERATTETCPKCLGTGV